MRCFNWKVLGGLAAAGLVLFLFAPSAVSGAAPLLIALACPLSMVVMMRGMSGAQCRRDDAETNAGRTPTVVSAEAEIARLRAEVDQLRAERAGLEGQPAGLEGQPPSHDGVALEDRR
jgi:hypothetical protein